MEKFKQTLKLKNTGSLFNYLMGNNATAPKEGEYCTFLHHSDRSVGIVRKVDGNRIVVEHCNANKKFPDAQMGHQDWVLTPNGNTEELVYRYGGWRRMYTYPGCDKAYQSPKINILFGEADYHYDWGF